MEGQGYEGALRGIIRMLLSLAMLAERASATCYPVRCLVLLFLRPGEAVAREFVFDAVQPTLFIADLPAFLDDYSPAEAICLAMRFRALAAAFEHMLHQPPRFVWDIRRIAGLFAHWNAGAPKLAPVMAGILPVQAAAAARARQPNDTS